MKRKKKRTAYSKDILALAKREGGEVELDAPQWRQAYGLISEAIHDFDFLFRMLRVGAQRLAKKGRRR